MADKVKLSVAFLLLALGVAGYYALDNSPLVLRVLSVLAGFIAAVTMAWFTQPGKQFYAFSQESVAEARKVVWPTRKETLQMTGIVMLFVIAMGLFIWGVDSILLWFVHMVMGRQS